MQLVVELGGTCKCGYSNIETLDLHHKHIDGKADRARFKSTEGMWKYYLSHIDEAKERLEPMCKNCHNEITRIRRGWSTSKSVSFVPTRAGYTIQSGTISMLQKLAQSGGSLPTRKLLEQCGSWGHTMQLIKKAESEGFITRKLVPSEGKGNIQTYNVLTDKGNKLIELARQVIEL